VRYEPNRSHVDLAASLLAQSLADGVLEVDAEVLQEADEYATLKESVDKSRPRVHKR
jgi:hypothetical protein